MLFQYIIIVLKVKRKKVFTMKKNATKKLLLPALLLTLCFTFIKAPTIPPTAPEDATAQVMPCSNLAETDSNEDD